MDNKPSKGTGYLRYMGLAFQFVATILLFVFGGDWLDDKVGNETPWFTLLGALIGVLGSMVYLIMRIGNKN